MSGDPSNAALWANADVYIAEIGTALPTDVDDPFDVLDWDLVGLLDGDVGFEHSGDFQAKDDFYAFGGLLVRTARRNWKQQVKFTALENNETVLRLFSPYDVPTRDPFLLALETTEGDVVHRVITSDHAEVDAREPLKDSESDLRKYGFTVTIYPDSDGSLWTPQDTADGS